MPPLAAQLEGGAFNLPANAETYQLTLLNDGELASATFTAALNPSGGACADNQPVGTPEVSPTNSIALPVLQPSGPCVLATLRAGVVNARSGPDTTFSVVSTISPMSTYNVVGRTADNSWYQIDYGGGTGWVAGFVTRLGGICSNVPVTYTPPTITPPTPQATLQIAGDNEINTDIPYARGTSVGFSGALSYPQGDRQDTISYHLTDVPSSVPSGVQFRYSILCYGTGVEYAQIRFSDGSTRPCTPDRANFTEYVTDNSPRSDFFTVVLLGGDNAYVTWSVQFNWYIP